jgi:hypothetical protein
VNKMSPPANDNNPKISATPFIWRDPKTIPPRSTLERMRLFVSGKEFFRPDHVLEMIGEGLNLMAYRLRGDDTVSIRSAMSKIDKIMRRNWVDDYSDIVAQQVVREMFAVIDKP